MWILENVISGLAILASGMLTLINEAITDIFTLILKANQTTYVVDACTLMMTIAVAMVTMLTIKNGLDVYVFETEGDPEQDPMEIITRMAQSLAVIGSTCWIFDEVMKVSEAFANDLGGINGTGINESLNSLLVDERYGTTGFFVNQTASFYAFQLVVAFITIGVIIFYVTSGIRGAELTLMKILMPIFALDLLNNARERWKPFIADYLITFFSFGLQLFCFKMLVLSVTNLEGADQIMLGYLPQVVGWLFLAIRAPKWLEKYMYTSGAKQSASGAARGMMGAAYAARAVGI